MTVYVSPRILLRQRAAALLPLLPGLLPGMEGLKIEQTRSTAVPEEDLPFLGFYATDEDGTSTGSSPVFDVSSTLIVAGRVRSIRQDEAEEQIDALMNGAKTLLMLSETFTRAPIFGVSRIELGTEISGSGSNFIGSGALKLHVSMREELYPVPTDDLLKIVTTLRPFGDPALDFTVTRTLLTS